MDKISLNIGCGEHKIEGFINIDCVKTDSVNPDLLLDITRENLPHYNDSVDEIWMIHCLEHIEIFKWNHIFQEFKRVLKPNGLLCLAYPEFKECAERFLNDTNKQKNFWRATLYGRQLYDSDYHVVPMDSNEIKEILEIAGFYRVNRRPESGNEPYNTIMVAYKDPDHITREMVLTKELQLEVADNWNTGDHLL